MNQRTRIFTLTFFAAAFIAVCVMTCRSFLSADHPTVRSTDLKCHIRLSQQQLYVDLGGAGHISQVRIQRPDGTLVATHPGCGTSQCNYSIAHLPSGIYHITVLSTTASFDGDIDWHSPLEAKP
ncbi:MAG: hypothetical protein JST90_06720 [Bacteroidetes bacterium]|nr:hypothetical protein [Bacteroidota bacterium]